MMKVSLCVFSCVVFYGVGGAVVNKKALYEQFDLVCYRNRNDVNSCIKKAMQHYLVKFKNGIPGLYRGSFDPLFMREMVQRYDAGVLKGEAITIDQNIHGFSKMKILNVRAYLKDPLKFALEFDYLIPDMTVDGNFKLNGRIFNFRVGGSGPFSVNLKNVKGTWTLTGFREKGEPTMEMTSFCGRPAIGDMFIKASNVVDGNPSLSRLVINVLNQTWKPLIPIAEPVVEKEFEQFVLPLLNGIFLEVPYDLLFPLAEDKNSQKAA